ncbi:MAG: hypothetical protein A2Y33_08945 [Spirochaetes bacterium GWF1_51_8]|nr:MAG: hypothetical protein A2Y33_08945 [Spirochaetes bacterium GWF1_51_8]
MGRILAIDVGEKRIGLAVSDDLRMVASPLDVYQKNGDIFIRLEKLCREYKVTGIVLGLPVSKKHIEAETMVNKFADGLRMSFAEKLDIEILFQDESFSSVYAESWMKTEGYHRKKIRSDSDKYAALKILEDYLTRGAE